MAAILRDSGKDIKASFTIQSQANIIYAAKPSSDLPMEEEDDNPIPQFDADAVQIVAAADPPIDLINVNVDVGGGATGVGLGGSVPTSVGVAFGGSIIDQLVDDVHDSASRVCQSQLIAAETTIVNHSQDDKMSTTENERVAKANKEFNTTTPKPITMLDAVTTPPV